MSGNALAHVSTHDSIALLISTLVVIAAVVSPALAHSAHDSKQRDLSGRWRLNQELSAYSRDSMPEKVERNERVVNGNWAIVVKDSQSALAGARVRELLDATTSLEIFQDARKITMNATGSAFVVLTRTIYTDGRPEQRFGLGGEGESQAQWNKKQFIVETKTKRGPKLTETYEVSPGGRRLYLLVKVENEGWTRPLLIRRVYDRESTSSHHSSR